MTTTYKAIIKGKSCVVSWNENLLLVDGTPYKVEPMNMSCDVLRRYKLLKVSELKFIGGTSSTPNGRWLVDGAESVANVLDPARIGRRKVTRTEAQTYNVFGNILDGKPPSWFMYKFPFPTPSELKARAIAVAWVKNYYHRFSKRTVVALPIVLSAFEPEKQHAEAQAAANHLKNAADAAAKQIRAVNAELRASTEQLAEVAQPFREMYKDQRLAGTKSDALKAAIPELVVDTIVSFYHKSKLPTTDGLVKNLNSSGIATKLESAGHGTSRATVGRWLKDVKGIMRRRGLIQNTRSPKKNAKGQLADNSAGVENFNSAANQSGLTSADTRTQELPEGSEVVES